MELTEIGHAIRTRCTGTVVDVGHGPRATTNCSLATAPRALPIQPTFLPALSPELTVPSHQLGAPTGVLAQAYDESQTVDNVLFRLKLEGCRSIANAKPAASPGSGVIDSSTYKPKTEFDNTPWRFDMNQNGKRMTAEEFDQWMKSRGVRVAKGAAVQPRPRRRPRIVDCGARYGRRPRRPRRTPRLRAHRPARRPALIPSRPSHRWPIPRHRDTDSHARSPSAACVRARKRPSGFAQGA